MNQRERFPEELSPGNYSNIKYWTVKSSPEQFIISPGSIPWTTIAIVETFVCGLSAAILFFFAKLSQHSHESPNLMILIPMCVIFASVALGCFFLPISQVWNERNKGDILVYDSNREVLNLPREKLALRKSQVVEFRILEERPMPDKKGNDFACAIAPSAELKLIFKNPSPKSVTLLRTSGVSFADVIEGIKQSNLSKIMLHQQKPEAAAWEIREI